MPFATSATTSTKIRLKYVKFSHYLLSSHVDHELMHGASTPTLVDFQKLQSDMIDSLTELPERSHHPYSGVKHCKCTLHQARPRCHLNNKSTWLY